MTALHLAACVVALLAGALVLGTAKGTLQHRRVGWLYIAATIVYAVSSFAIPTSSGGLTVFHAISVQGLVLVALGVVANRRGGRQGRVWHIRLMSFSYVALAATGLRFTLPALGIGRAGPVVIFSVLPFVAWLWIERRFVRPTRPAATPSER